MAAKTKKTNNAPTGTKKIKKDGPKRPLTGYMHFTKKRRLTLLEEKPELKSRVTEISKIIGAEWQTLEEPEKQKYMKLAQEDKENYELAKAKAV